ncbi:MAG: hypothetical protein ABII09_10990 [Planctomycetota bacterium]
MSDSENVVGQIVAGEKNDLTKHLSKFLAKEITKALTPSPPLYSKEEPTDYLLECAERVIEELLKIKDNKQRGSLLRKFTQRCQEAKECLRKDDIRKPLPDTFLRDIYDYIDKIDEYVISSLEKSKNSHREFRRLRNIRDSIFSRWIALNSSRTSEYIQEQIDLAEKEKLPTQESNGRKKERKPKSSNVQRSKTPPQILKETRERQAAKLLAESSEKGEHLTAENLGKKLGCDKSTAVRLEAWKKQGMLGVKEPPNGNKLRNESGADIEAYEKLPAKPS